ncbi:MAG: sulfur carrier protein ThiS [Phycisphaerales bacterium]
MVVIVNGDRHEVPEGLCVAGLLLRLGLGAAACAVEINRALVPKRAHESRALEEGDRIEIVSLVGGG